MTYLAVPWTEPRPSSCRSFRLLFSLFFTISKGGRSREYSTGTVLLVVGTSIGSRYYYGTPGTVLLLY